jgi:hypothetical protein
MIFLLSALDTGPLGLHNWHILGSKLLGEVTLVQGL